jgi:hypothetical protein
MYQPARDTEADSLARYVDQQLAAIRAGPARGPPDIIREQLDGE